MRLMVYTAVREASPQKDYGQLEEISKAQTVSRMWRCFLSARPFCCEMPGHDFEEGSHSRPEMSENLSLYSYALSDL